ncbi:MAG: hypothetical protein J07HQX50_00127 [Haloquadratum sp. J07HQX50]|nr:MAG: hypothetical protein J07HQX50_00127 [Haloquadratum sp. J07HQX50]
MKTSRFLSARVIAFAGFLQEIVAVPVLFQTIAGVQIGILRAVRDGREVTNAEVNTRRFVTGCVGSVDVDVNVDVIFTDEVEFPPFFRLVADGSDLLQVLNSDIGACLVLEKNEFPRFRVFVLITTL